MLIDYFKGKKSHADNLNVFLLSFTAFAAGYTVADFHEKFLDFFTTPLGQFIVYYIILHTVYVGDPEVTTNDLITEALIYVLILQVLKLVIQKYHSNST